MTAPEQQTDGTVRCESVTLLTDGGRPARAVRHGATVQVVAEFDVQEPLEVAAGWIEIRNSSGLLVHGRDGFAAGRVSRVAAGTVIRCVYTVRLDLGPGEYRVAAGVSSVDGDSYREYSSERPPTRWPEEASPAADALLPPRLLPEERFRSRVVEHCRADAGLLAIGFDAAGRRPYSGLAALEGDLSLTAVAPAPKARPRRGSQVDRAPSLVHVTHPKAGSQWIADILHAAAPGRVEQQVLYAAHFRFNPLRSGRVYPAVYVTRDEFDAVPGAESCLRFVVIRDPRDTLVSGYFSFTNVHEMQTRGQLEFRRVLKMLSREQALLFLTDRWLPRVARIQLSWLESGAELIRYEDLLEDDVGILTRVLIDECDSGIDSGRLREAILANRFERRARGRARGREDAESHLRKGVDGEWREHFDEQLKFAFKARFGGLLVATGYEKDLAW